MVGYHNAATFVGEVLANGSFTVDNAVINGTTEAQTQVVAINNVGQEAGFYIDGNGVNHGFIENNGSFTTEDDGNGTLTQLLGINDGGTAVGYYQNGASNQVAVELTSGNFSTINLNNGSTIAQATAINNGGTIVGFFTDAGGTTHGFVDAGGAITTLDVTGATFTQALGINNNGEIVGTFTDSAGNTHGFTDIGNTFQTIDAPGASGTAVTNTVINGVNDSGELVGFNLDFANNTDGFIATVACFHRGTPIATTAGERAVEALRVGDVVATAEGGARPVIWIGHRRIDCRRHPRPWDIMPVRVRAGAFGDGLPRRDVLLSPDHAVLCDGALVPVRYLLNGASIVQESVAQVEYWHVELDQHDVVLAAGLPCESYLDTGNRGAFAAEGEAVSLHPDFARGVWDRASCAPLLTAGPALAVFRAGLADRLPALGFTVTEDPAVRLLADGAALPEPAAPGETLRVVLPAGTRRLRILSHAAAPADLDPAGSDRRRLGVAVTRIVLDNEVLGLDDARLGAGWHAPEPAMRWTDGAASLDLLGARRVEIAFARPGLRYAVAVSQPSIRRVA